MLEDDFTYVLRKALKGHDLAPSAAAQLAGLSEHAVLAFSKGKFSEEIARGLARVLGLDEDSFAHHDQYLPAPLAVPQIHRLDLPFHDEQVNAWLINDGEVCLLFDTGYGPEICLKALEAIGAPPPQQIYITHAHRDHIGGNDTFRRLGIPICGDAVDGASPMHPGEETRHGKLTVRACDLSGHATPALGFHVDGLAVPVLVTGDALFAGSMGGCDNPAVFRHALSRLHDVLTPLPGSTVLLPGHGPATTLAEEWIANPFLHRKR